jgi:prolyl-tRNA synthetase
VRSPGGYTANVEAVTTPAPEPVTYDDAPAAHVEDTPDTPTIETLVAHANEHHPRPDRPWEAADTLKNVVVTLVQPDGTREPLAIGVPGDRDVDLRRLAGQVEPAEVEPFTDADFAAHPALVAGYLGPEVLGVDGPSGVRYLVDPRVVTGTRWVTGANEPGRHVFDLVCGRDFEPDGIIDVADVRDGDPAPDGSGPLELQRGIEIGHIFQLGRRYAEALELQVLDEHGKLVTPTMGSYGIGVSRVVAAIAETTADELGLCWPRAVAPADVHVVLAGASDEVVAAGERLATELDAAGVRVLLDDRRGPSAGVKFKDAELLGMPTIVVVGKRLADGMVEVRDRRSDERTEVAVDEAVAHLVARCAG